LSIRRALLIGITALALGATSTAAADVADETALAERFAPVVRLVEQAEECGYGEPYRPIDVDAIFAEPTVSLRGPCTRPTSSRSLRRRRTSTASTSTTSTSPGARSTPDVPTSSGRIA
jgi:hypothetical protein